MLTSRVFIDNMAVSTVPRREHDAMNRFWVSGFTPEPRISLCRYSTGASLHDLSTKTAAAFTATPIHTSTIPLLPTLSQEDGRLPIRVFLTLLHDEIEQAPTASCKTSAGDEASSVDGVSIEDDGGEESSRKPWSGGEGLLSWHRVKLFADGSLGTLGKT